MARRLAAILFTDIVGYSALAQADEAAALAALEDHNRTLRPVFAEFHGREVKTIGDAFLVAFDSALDAVNCAVEAQRRLTSLSPRPGAEKPVCIRVGIHLGDVVEEDGDVLGDAVNIASRIVGHADPGGICVSQQVYDQVLNKSTISFVQLPPVRLKNIRRPLTLYRVDGAAPRSARRAPPESEATGQQIAVLPLTNISPDANDGYFADGLTEELISTLSQIQGLQVTARTSVLPYKNAPKPVAEIAHELGVESILEGSVRKAGNRIRISLQLVDPATQKHVWATTYNREVDDVFAVQIDIAERTAKALRLEFDRTKRPDRSRPSVPHPRFGVVTGGVAYDRYLRGLALVSQLHGDSPERAMRCFEEATTLDPTLADAYAAWANLYVTASGDSLPMREAIPKARTLATRAVELDPTSSDAHAALGNIALQYDNDWVRSEAEFEWAIELNASNVTALSFYGLLLLTIGRLEEAKALYRRAAQLDPGGHHRSSLGRVEVESGNFDEGLRISAETSGPHEESVAHRMRLGFLYLQAGRPEEARRAAELPLPKDASDDDRFDSALLNALVGHPAAARRVVAETERGKARSYTSASHLAMMYSALGNKSKALDLLEQDYREGDRVLWLYYRGAYFDPIRDEPRFASLIRQMGLPPEVLRPAPALAN